MKISSLVINEGNPTDVSNKLREDWNKYIDWLEKKGYKGSPALDKNDFGGKMIDMYRRENPQTTVSRETIKPIQQEFSKYRDWSLDQVKQGKAMLSSGATPDNYMKSLSIIDGIAGQRTTSFRFPESYLTTFKNGQNTGTKNLGFATIQK